MFWVATGEAMALSRGRLRTVIERTSTTKPQSETRTLATHFGKSVQDLFASRRHAANKKTRRINKRAVGLSLWQLPF